MIFMLSDNRFVKLAAVVLASLLLMQQCILVQPVLAQSSPKDLLRKGVQQCEDAEFENAITSLEQALTRGLSDKEDIIQAYKYIAFSAAALGDEAKAENAYVELLKRYPVFDLLLSDSPRLRKPFDSAREKVEQWRQTPPAIECEPLRTAEVGAPVEVTARVTAAAGVDSVVLHFKRTTEVVYLKQLMVNSTGAVFAAMLPASTEPANWMYYITARSKNGKIADWRSAGNPQVVVVTAAKKKSKTWLYVALGALALGGGGAAAAMAGGGGETPEPPTSNKLPDPPGTP